MSGGDEAGPEGSPTVNAFFLVVVELVDRKMIAIAAKNVEEEALAFLTVNGPGVSILSRPKGSILFAQDYPATSLIYVQSGRVKLTVTSENGKEGILAIVGARHFLGEVCLGHQTLYASTATTLEDCVLTVISAPVMRAKLQSSAELSDLFIDHLVRRNARVEADLVTQLFDPVDKRLARLLLRLAEYGKVKSPIVPFSVTQQELADMIGATRANVSKLMAEFRRRGYISYDGNIQVHHTLISDMLGEAVELDWGDD